MAKLKPGTRESVKSLYFIALIPDHEFRREVKKIKENIQESYGSGHALRSPAHITLHMPFKWRDDRIHILEKNLEDFAADRSGFTIELENFGSFPKRVIFINVKESKALNILHTMLLKMAAQKLKLNNGRYRGMAFHPHMTIAFRDLKPAMFEEAWQEYQMKKLTHSFTVRSVFLLKHNGTAWDIFKEFSFQSV